MAQSADCLDLVRNYTKSSRARLEGMADALCAIECEDIPGDVVEVGVWRAGNIMLARMLAPDRVCWLYDTFDGMTEPDPELDIKLTGALNRAIDTWNAKRKVGCKWAAVSIDDVQQGFNTIGVSTERMHFVEGPVERTLDKVVPLRIAILRLDVDWHAPTKVALEKLYPLVVAGGFLIVDDYGHWAGARKAVNDYFGDAAPPWRDADYTCRIFRKCS
jgi:hypothetical protein